ncbi:hypothetical protein TIFTF001_053121 [Ficus carica]|uniref:Uncharacterized protein n=1 Tax=Ficus carica TaxID=3494 RepID=A0AA88EGD2_FICCA|nr:hypothetical protein TIFTF001_053121 [Ficus carica]
MRSQEELSRERQPYGPAAQPLNERGTTVMEEWYNPGREALSLPSTMAETSRKGGDEQHGCRKGKLSLSLSRGWSGEREWRRRRRVWHAQGVWEYLEDND